MDLKKMLTGHLLVLALTFPHAALAEDFTFNVQVNLSHMHQDVAKLRIHCGASISHAGGMIGEKILEIDVPANGTFNNTVQVAFNASPGQNLRAAKVYRCETRLIDRNANPGSARAGTSSECQNSANDWRCGKPGTPFAMIFFGSFP
jgi:hypothetical protein